MIMPSSSAISRRRPRAPGRHLTHRKIRRDSPRIAGPLELRDRSWPHASSTAKLWRPRCRPRSPPPSPSKSKAGGPKPGLATVLVGDDPASHVYVRNKRRTCEQVGMTSVHHELPATTSQTELLDLVDKLNDDPAVHGILVQLPLPKQIDEAAIIHAVAPHKDVDCFHPENVGPAHDRPAALLAVHAARRAATARAQRHRRRRQACRDRRPEQYRRQAAGPAPDAERRRAATRP